MHPSEVYSSLYYDIKIKPRVLQEKGDRVLSRAEKLLLIKKVTQKMFAAETDEVKVEVAEKLSKMKEVHKKTLDEDEDNKDGGGPSSLERRPEEYQRCVYFYSMPIRHLQPDWQGAY
jgi:uncharacterized protein YgfB (UPF0149 family)